MVDMQTEEFFIFQYSWDSRSISVAAESEKDADEVIKEAMKSEEGDPHIRLLHEWFKRASPPRQLSMDCRSKERGVIWNHDEP